MSASFNPEKINNPYALLGAFLLVVSVFFGTWFLTIDKENTNERYCLGIMAVFLFSIFLIIFYKIQTHKSSAIETSSGNSHLTIEKDYFIHRANLEVKIFELNELMKSAIENHDWIAVQKINSIIAYLENRKKVSFVTEKDADPTNYIPQIDDVSQILSKILTVTR